MAKLLKIMQRGPAKVLAGRYTFSSHSEPSGGPCTAVQMTWWGADDRYDYRFEMNADEARSLRESLNLVLDAGS